MMLHAARTRLRLLRADDLDALVALDSDPKVMRFITGGAPTPREIYADRLLPRMLGYAETHPGMGYFAIERGTDGRFLGWSHLRPDRFEPAWGEIGYRLHRACWSQGFATEVARALIGHAFGTLGLEIVSARTAPENTASRRVLEKCGLMLRGTFEWPAADLGTFHLPAAPGVLYVRTRADAMTNSEDRPTRQQL